MHKLCSCVQTHKLCVHVTSYVQSMCLCYKLCTNYVFMLQAMHKICVHVYLQTMYMYYDCACKLCAEPLCVQTMYCVCAAMFKEGDNYFFFSFFSKKDTSTSLVQILLLLLFTWLLITVFLFLSSPLLLLQVKQKRKEREKQRSPFPIFRVLCLRSRTPLVGTAVKKKYRKPL